MYTDKKANMLILITFNWLGTITNITIFIAVFFRNRRWRLTFQFLKKVIPQKKYKTKRTALSSEFRLFRTKEKAIIFDSLRTKQWEVRLQKFSCSVKTV
jgi:hypothetical protein